MDKFELNELTDEQLLQIFADGNESAFVILLSRYSNLIMKIASSFEVTSLNEAEDYYQEGLMEFFSSAKSFDPNKGMSFKNYSMMLVRQTMQRVYNASTSKKRKPNKPIISIDDVSEFTSAELAIEDEVINKQIVNTFDSFSAFELDVAKLYILGLKPAEIANKLKCSVKKVYNALQRIRVKLKDD